MKGNKENSHFFRTQRGELATGYVRSILGDYEGVNYLDGGTTSLSTCPETKAFLENMLVTTEMKQCKKHAYMLFIEVDDSFQRNDRGRSKENLLNIREGLSYTSKCHVTISDVLQRKASLKPTSLNNLSKKKYYRRLKQF